MRSVHGHPQGGGGAGCSGGSMRVRPSASVHAEACARSGARGPPPAMPPAFTDGVPVGEACSPTRGDPDAAEADSLVQSWVHGAPGRGVRGCGQAAWGPKGRGRPCSVLLCTGLTNVTPSSLLCLGIHGPAEAGQLSVDAGSHPATPGPGSHTGVRPVPAGASPLLHPTYLEFALRGGAGGGGGLDLGFLPPPRASADLQCLQGALSRRGCPVLPGQVA